MCIKKENVFHGNVMGINEQFDQNTKRNQFNFICKTFYYLLSGRETFAINSETI